MVDKIDVNLQKRLADILMQMSITETYEGRSALLRGAPNVAMDRSQTNRLLDLDLIVEQLAALGRDKKQGIRPLIVVTDNARRQLGDWQGDLTEALEQVRQELEKAYANDNQPAELPPVDAESLLFEGRDERVAVEFLSKALATARSVCRLSVPRFYSGVRHTGAPITGTGWIIAPGLIITNYHVVEARQRLTEAAATEADLQQQVTELVAWFDYLSEGGTFVEVRNMTLVASDGRDGGLDYALLRVAKPKEIEDRTPLTLVSQQPTLVRGQRLNIAQHSGGGALVYAIRNNFYVGAGKSAAFLRYLTDTAKGASGAPVLSDGWEVIGLHHAAAPIPPETYASLPRERFLPMHKDTYSREVIRYHNEGIAIHSILASLPAHLHVEIAAAQS